MIQDLKEDLDVDRIKRASPAVTTRSKVKEAKQQIVEEVNEGDSVTCLGFPCMDITCIVHYMDIRRTFGQAAGAKIFMI